MANTSPSEIPGGHSSREYKSHLAEVSSSHGRPNAEDERCEDSHEARSARVCFLGHLVTQVLEMVRSFPTPYHKLKQDSSKEGIFLSPYPGVI